MSRRRFDVDLLLDLFISAKAFKAADLWDHISFAIPFLFQWIGLRENIQESLMIFMWKSMVSG